MKKSILLLIIAALFIGCSPDEIIQSYVSGSIEENASRPGPPDIRLDPTKLKKVIFLPGTSSQKTWIFYENGLLRKSTNGAITETFVYDNNKNLISVTKVASTGTTITTFVYDTNNRVTSVNGYPITYDGSQNKYIFYYEIPPGQFDEWPFARRTEFALNSDGLPLSRKMFFGHIMKGEQLVVAIAATYLNGNLITVMEQDFETIQNYQFDTNPNPIKAAILPICKVMPLVNGYQVFPGYDQWINGNFSSTNNVSHLSHYSEDPETTSMTYTYNVNNLPVSQTMQHYYFGELDGAPFESIHYYYQGEATPQ